MLRGVSVGVLALCLTAAAQAQISDGAVRVGVLNDQSGPYSDFGGEGSVIAAWMAVEDFGGTVLGKPIEVLSADHRNKPDLASAIAREWIDTNGADALLELTTSAVALAVQEIAKAHNRAMLVSSASSADLTDKSCTPITVHWGFDSYGISSVATKATVATGGDTWFFLTGDNAGSHAQEQQARLFLDQAGAKVLGAIRHPLGTADFSSYLLQAQASKARVIALANAGGDTINALKQAQEFGIAAAGQNIVPMLTFITDIDSLGLRAAQKLKLATAFYWNADEEKRAWSRRFMERNKGRAPTMAQAGVYSLVTHYLKAVAATGSDAADVVVGKMKEVRVNDSLWKNVRIREDGRSLNDLYLIEVKTPAESKGPWDYYRLLSTVPGEEAFRPLKDGGCPFVTAM